jgi:serine/threonine-protein kinase
MSSLIGQRIGNYEIVSKLGAGGMATVYRARQISIERDVAIKIIKGDLADSQDFVQRFEREAKTIAALDHPHILKLFDYGQSGDLLYLVMEIKTGGSLDQVLRQKPLSSGQLVKIVFQIASALDHAHKRGIVHRDLKPQNILLDENGNAFLTDFGIAKLMGTQIISLTASGMAMGTPAYMSPEQWLGQAVDSRADIYAFGIMLYEMIGGRIPFTAETPYALMHMHVNEPPPPLSQYRPDVLPGVQRVIEKAIAKRPDDRFQTVQAFAIALKSAFAGKDPVPADSDGPITAPVVRPPTQVQQRKRFPVLYLISATALILLLGTGLFFLSRSLTANGSPSTQLAALPPSSTASLTPTLPPTQAATHTVSPKPSHTTTPTLLPSVTPSRTLMATFTATPTLTATSTPLNDDDIVATFIATQSTATAMALATTNRIQTLVSGASMTASAQTAIAVLSATKTPTSTITPTLPPKVPVVMATIKVGNGPTSVDLNPITNMVYVASPETNTIDVIDGATNKLVTTIPVANSPVVIAVSPKSNMIYVGHNSGSTNGLVSIINGATNTVVETVNVTGQASAIAVNPATNMIYAVTYQGGVNVIDGATQKLITTISSVNAPNTIAVNPLLNTLYVGDSDQGVLDIIDASTYTILASLNIGSKLGGVGVNYVTNRIYITKNGILNAIDGPTHKVTSLFKVGCECSQAKVNAQTNIIYIVSFLTYTVNVIDGASNKSIAVLKVGIGPNSGAVNVTTDTFYVTNYVSNTVSVIGWR